MNLLSSRLSWAAVIALIFFVLFLLVNLWTVFCWQNALINNVQLTDSVSISLNTSTQVARQLRSENITFSEVSLPAVPEKITVSVEKQKPKTNAAKKATANSDATYQYLTAQVYEQFISDPSVDIEIAWPDSVKARDRLFAYLYSCVGMQFAVMNGGKVTLISKTTGRARSAWLRVAKGLLNKQEIRWLQQSSLSGVPVRLFPKAIDWQLAQHITGYLKGADLQSFRGRYKLSSQGVVISHIVINKQNIGRDWLLGLSCIN